MQDMLSPTAKAQVLLDSVTFGDILRMIDSAGVNSGKADHRERSAQAKAILINSIGIFTQGHSVPDKPECKLLLGAMLDAIEDPKEKVALTFEIIKTLGSLSK